MSNIMRYENFVLPVFTVSNQKYYILKILNLLQDFKYDVLSSILIYQNLWYQLTAKTCLQ